MSSKLAAPFTFLTVIYEGSNFSTTSQHCLLSFFIIAILCSVNSPAMNIGELISLQDPDFNSIGIVHRSGIVESYGRSIFSFLRNIHSK